MSAPAKLKVTPTAIHDVLVIEPKVFGDERGWFTESFNAQDFAIAIGLNVAFVQDNLNRYQYPRHLPTSLGTAFQILPEISHCCNYGV